MTSRACRTKRRPRSRPVHGSDDPDIWTLSDLARALGFKSRRAAYTFLRTHPDFPRGVRVLQATGRMRWHAPSCRAWLDKFWSNPPQEMSA